jgi:hypothetical protein
MPGKQHRLAIVFPADAGERLSTKLEQSRFARVATAIGSLGVEVEGAPYADEAVEQVRAQLLRVDGVLVWVNPIQAGRDRSILNAMLAEVAATGVFVSAHPELIHKMGTKEVLYRTQKMSWGCDTLHYPALQAMRAEFPACLASGAPRVLKQMRGQSGDGVWKVELAKRAGSEPTELSLDATVRVRHAKRGSVEEEIPLEQFLSRCEPYFAGQGGMIDQAYQSRLPEGMVRCYLVRDRVAGFGEQLVNALCPAATGAPSNEAPQPGPRLYYPPTRPDFQPLKDKLEREWLGELCRILALDQERLPVIWDADFLYGPKDADGADTYVLCEICTGCHPRQREEQVGPARDACQRLEQAAHEQDAAKNDQDHDRPNERGEVRIDVLDTHLGEDHRRRCERSEPRQPNRA